MNFQSEEDYNNYFNNNVLNSTDSMEIMLHKLCCVNGNNLIIDYRIFKSIGSTSTYNAIFKHVDDIVSNTMTKFPILNVHLSMKSLSIVDTDKHSQFLINLIQHFNRTYKNILDVGNIYLAPSIFVQVFSIFSFVIDKDTKKKINIVEKHKNKSQISLQS
jgi:hypothetical protein